MVKIKFKRIKGGGILLSVVIDKHNPSSTKQKLSKLRDRAMMRKVRIGTNTPGDENIKIANQNFSDLEKEIYSIIKDK